jgi:hypothetical protein
VEKNQRRTLRVCALRIAQRQIDNDRRRSTRVKLQQKLICVADRYGLEDTLIALRCQSTDYFIVSAHRAMNTYDWEEG